MAKREEESFSCPRLPSFYILSSRSFFLVFVLNHAYPFVLIYYYINQRYLAILLYQRLYSISYTLIGFAVVSALRRSVGADITSYRTRDRSGSHEATGYM